MTRTFECPMCAPGCTLQTDEDEIEVPSGCPWPAAVNAPRWREADDGEVGPA
jgi:hypothetical protein